MTDQEWLALAPGKPCRTCRREVYRLVEGRCLQCHGQSLVEADAQERKEEDLRQDARKHGLWTFGKKKRRAG